MNKGKLLMIGLAVALALSLSLGGLALARSSNKGGNVEVVPVSDSTKLPISGAFFSAPVMSGQQQVGLWVTGTGKVTAKPDIAVVGLGIEVEAKTVADAQQQAQQAMNAIMASLTAKGVADKDIKTSSFSIQPVYNYTTDPRGAQQRFLEGYQVTSTTTLSVDNYRQ